MIDFVSVLCGLLAVPAADLRPSLGDFTMLLVMSDNLGRVTSKLTNALFETQGFIFSV